jgi:3-dehydroquinate synthase
VTAGAADARVRVELGPRSYDIAIGPGLLGRCAPLLAPLLAGRRVVPVADAAVLPLHWPALRASLEASGAAVAEPVAVPPGESSKDFATLAQLLETLLSRGLDRRSVLVALGGGVVGDLVGFAAAVALRGIGFVQAPTTLLAQVDSSVGGKTGINAAAGKNLVGAFHQPLAVVVDTSALDTLPEREVLAGYAEVAKYGLLGDEALFAWLEGGGGAAVVAGDPAARARAVEASCRMKADVVARDETEAGDRALLNFGHTFGHALEAHAGFDGRLLHGEAVAIGMVQAFRLSERLGHCAAGAADRVAAHLAAVGLPVRPSDRGLSPTPDELLAHMAKDKKADGGRLAFVLARGIGRAFVARGVDPADVRAVLAAS